MGNPARGTQLVIGIQDEASYAVDPAANADLLPVVSSSLVGQQNVINSATLLGSRTRGTPARGNINVSGNIVTELSAQAYGKLFKHLLGTDTPSGANPYTHTITVSDLPVGFLLDVDHGSVLAGSYRYEHFNGVRVKSFQAEFKAEGLQLATWELLGAKQTFSASAFDGTLTDNSHTPFFGTEMTLKEGGSTIAYATRCMMRVNNNLEEDKYAIGGAGVRRSAPEAFVDVEGELELLAEDTAVFAKAIAGTETSLQIICTRGTGLGSAGNEYLEILVGKLQYDRTSARTPGPGSKMFTLPFKGYKASGVGPIQVVIKNAVATI